MGDYDKALEFYGKAMAISVKTLGDNHPSVATTYNNIGNTYYKMDNVEQALDFYGKALAIYRSTFGDSQGSCCCSTIFIKPSPKMAC